MHFGLHVVENVITHGWNSLTEQQKAFMKQKAFELIGSSEELCCGTLECGMWNVEVLHAFVTFFVVYVVRYHHTVGVKSADEKSFVKEKVASIISEIAKREWPQVFLSNSRFAILGIVLTPLHL